MKTVTRFDWYDKDNNLIHTTYPTIELPDSLSRVDGATRLVVLYDTDWNVKEEGGNE